MVSDNELELLRVASDAAKARASEDKSQRQDSPTESFADFLGRVGARAAETAQSDRQPIERTKDDTKLLRARQLASIPPIFRDLTLDGPELASRVVSKQAIAQARMAVDASLGVPGYQGANRVVIVGPAGAGKTSLAAAMLRSRTERLLPTDRGGFFVTALRLAMARAGWGLGDGEPPEVWRALHTPILVLDELGAEANIATSAVSEVIHERHANNLPTWVTTGQCEPDGGSMKFDAPHVASWMSKRYGDGISRRLLEGATVIRCGGKP